MDDAALTDHTPRGLPRHAPWTPYAARRNRHITSYTDPTYNTQPLPLTHLGPHLAPLGDSPVELNAIRPFRARRRVQHQALLVETLPDESICGCVISMGFGVDRLGLSCGCVMGSGLMRRDESPSTILTYPNLKSNPRTVTPPVAAAYRHAPRKGGQTAPWTQRTRGLGSEG